MEIDRKMKVKGKLKYIMPMLLLAGIILTGCSKTQETTTENYEVSEEELSYALPKIGEAAIIKAEVQAGSKGTILVATVGSPNTEILQEAGRILGENGYLLNIEVCEDYLTPNQLVTEGKVDCNYYQHAAFLERYNIEKGTSLQEMAKIHYEPMAVFSQKVKNLDEIKKGAKVAVPENPTALSQALWLLQAEGLLTLMSDADLNAVKDDISENPLELEFISMKEEDVLKKLNEVDIALCHTGYALQEGLDTENILLAKEAKESMPAQSLSQSVVVSVYPNENAKILVDTLMSEEMQRFIETQYQGSIYMMDGELTDIEITEEVQQADEKNEDGKEASEED